MVIKHAPAVPAQCLLHHHPPARGAQDPGVPAGALCTFCPCDAALILLALIITGLPERTLLLRWWCMLLGWANCSWHNADQLSPCYCVLDWCLAQCRNTDRPGGCRPAPCCCAGTATAPPRARGVLPQEPGARRGPWLELGLGVIVGLSSALCTSSGRPEAAWL